MDSAPSDTVWYGGGILDDAPLGYLNENNDLDFSDLFGHLDPEISNNVIRDEVTDGFEHANHGFTSIFHPAEDENRPLASPLSFGKLPPEPGSKDCLEKHTYITVLAMSDLSYFSRNSFWGSLM